MTTLSYPSVPYIDIRDAIVSLLISNVATLNTNLTKTFSLATPAKQIMKGDPTKHPFSNTLYPCAFVDLMRKTEDFTALGSAGRKTPVVTYVIYGIVSKFTSSADAADECIRLAENIESVLRQNIQFHSRVLYSQPTDTAFNEGDLGGTYIYGVSITLDCTTNVY